MKKIIALLLTISLLMAVLSAPAHASNISEITADQYVMRCLPDLATLIASYPIMNLMGLI